MRTGVPDRGVRRLAVARALWSRIRIARPSPRWLLWAVVAGLGGAVAAGILFAGSTERIPAGVSVLGVKLSGLTPAEAKAVLENRAASLSSVPVIFTVAGRRFEIRPAEVDLRVDWGAVVAEARRAGDAPLLFRGLKRVRLRLFGVEFEPHADVYEAGLDFRLGQVATAVDRPPRDAAVVLEGLEPRLVPAFPGRELDVDAAKPIVIDALARFDRSRVPLPVRVTAPKVLTERLAPVLRQVRAALSGPVRLAHGETRWRIRPRRLARFLLLPADGTTTLRIGGPAAEDYFNRFAARFRREPRSADFAISADGTVNIVPAVNGRALDVPGTVRTLLAVALTPGRREAELAIVPVEPELTTQEARALGITRELARYGTAYAGSADRIKNLQLAVSTLDGALVGPGDTFSFNDVVGPRSESRGFRVAPVIIGREYDEAVGGGVSQVATTVFNAAWEAGLPIAERHPHALYIERYEAGRDATVDYPTLDMKFVNDTGAWLRLEAGFDEAGISVAILGPETGRRVVSEPGQLEEGESPKVRRERDPTLPRGERIVEDEGEPSRTITVVRTIYLGDQVLRRETWPTTYFSEPKIVRVGTQPVPEVEENSTSPGETVSGDQAGELPATGEETPPPEIDPAGTETSATG